MKTLEDFKAAFPTLYAHAGLFDFGCPPGWLDLVWELSTKLEPIGARAQQVKSKFGSLRFYTEGYSKEVSALVAKAEDDSCKTCEFCGKPGSRKTSKGGLVTTRCSEHSL